MKTKQLAFLNLQGEIFTIKFTDTIAIIENEYSSFSTEDVVDLFIQVSKDLMQEKLFLLGSL